MVNSRTKPLISVSTHSYYRILNLEIVHRFGSVKQLDVESHFRATISDRVIRFIYELTFHDHHRQDVMNTVLNIMSYKIVALLTQHAISRLTIGHFHEI